MDRSALSALLKVKLSAVWRNIANAMKSKKNGGKNGAIKSIAYLLVVIFAVAVLMVYFAMLFFVICEGFSLAGLSWFYFAIAGALALILCFTGSIFTTQAYIFRAKDNDLLMSMPIRPSYILVSRMASCLVLDYFYAFLVLIPAGVIYLIFNTVSAAGVVLYVLCSLLLPFLSQSLACVAAWVLEIITSRLRNKNFFTLFLSLCSLGLYFFVVSKISSYITVLMERGAEIANAVKNGFFPLYYLGSAITEHNFLSMLVVALACLIPFATAYYILSKNFIRLVSIKRTAAKKEYVEKKLNVRSPKLAIMMKDLNKLISSPTYMLNAAFGGLMAIIAVAVLPGKLSEVSFALMALNVWIDKNTLAIVLTALLLSACASMNYISAPSISLEAKTLWVIKTVPIDPKDLLLGKAYAHIVVTAPFVIIGGIVACVMGKITGINILLVFVLPLTVTVFGGLFGIAMNVQFPKFDWENEAKVIKQSASVIITMLSSMAFLVVLFGGYVALMYFRIKVDIILYMWCVTAVVLLADVILYAYIGKGGRKRFNQLGE